MAPKIPSWDDTEPLVSAPPAPSWDDTEPLDSAPATTPPPPQKPGLLSRAVSAVKGAFRSEPEPASDEEWAASIARKADEKAAARKRSLMEMSRTGLPIRTMLPDPVREPGPKSAPAGTRFDINAAQQPKRSITSPYSGVGGPYLGGRVDIRYAKRPDEPKTFQVPSREEFKKAVASRKDAWKRVWERDNVEARKAGFNVGKEYPTAEAAIRAYRESVGEPLPEPPESYEAFVEEMRDRWEAKKAAKAESIKAGEAFLKEQEMRSAAWRKARREHGEGFSRSGFPVTRKGFQDYLRSIGVELEAPAPSRSPEAFAEEKTGVSRGTSSVGRGMAAAGDVWSEVADKSGWSMVARALTGKSEAERAGERVMQAEAALEEAKEIRAIKAKRAAGEELTEIERRKLEANKFFAQMGAAIDAIKENPGEAAEAILVDLVENAPIYALTNMGSVGAAKALTSAVKSGRNAKRLADAIAKGKSAAAAEIRAQRTAQLGTKVIKPSKLKAIGLEVAADVPADVAVGMVLEKSRGRDYKAADLVTDLAASGIINVPIGALRSLQGGGVVTAREFRQIADAFGDIGALADNPAVADIVSRLRTLAADEVLIPEGLKVRASERAKAATPEEARAAGYGEDVAAGPESARAIRGSTQGQEITLRPEADIGTLEEEIATARFNALRKRASAAPDGPEAGLLQRINDWAANVHAENASRPEGQRVALPQQSENGNLELFTKVMAGEESGIELVPLVDIPDDIFNDWGRMFGSSVRAEGGDRVVRPGVMAGRWAPQETAAEPAIIEPVTAAPPSAAEPSASVVPSAAEPVAGPAAPRPSVMDIDRGLTGDAVRRPLPTEPPAAVEGLTPRGLTQEQIDAQAAADAALRAEVRRDVGRLKRRPITAYTRQGEGPLTPDALAVLEEIDGGADIPLSRLAKAAEDNGVPTDGGATAIITGLRAKAGKTGPVPARAEPYTPAAGRRPLRPGEVDEPVATPAADEAAAALARRMPAVVPEEPVGDLARIGRMARRPLPQYQLAGEAGAKPSEVAAARKAWREQGTDSPYFKRWFGDSKVVDEQGKPLVVYHGTGANIEAFDPEMTGKGNDQLGSGFYFTNDKSEADVYQLRDDPHTGEKLGGKASPNTIEAYVSIKKPIKIGLEHQNLRHIEIPKADAEKIIAKAPNIFDADESPLTNFIDNDGKAFTISDIKAVSREYDWDMMSLENDFFRDAPTAYREAVRDVTGYDGVEKTHGGGIKHYVAWFPTQIKSATGNRGTFDATDPRINYQLRGFRSKVRETIEKKMPNRASVKDVRGLLSGTSQDEMKWMGVDDYLAGKIQVNKADLLKYMDENAVDVQEVMKGERGAKSAKERMEQLLEIEDRSLRQENELSDIENGDWVVGDDDYDVGGGTKFSEWQLPGGENYRELLLTLPARPVKVEPVDVNGWRVETVRDNQLTGQREIKIYDNNGDLRGSRSGFRGTDAEAIQDAAASAERNLSVNAARDAVYRVPDAHAYGDDASDVNRLAHVRFNDRTTADGKKILFLEEVQSDWHQEGRKKGYKGSDEWTEVDSDRFRELNATPESALTPEQKAELATLYGRRSAADAGVPDAPFKKTWHELALRRMLQYAAENGYDGVAWLPGAEQAARYDLSKHVGRIQIEAESANTRFVDLDLHAGEDIMLKVNADGTIRDGEFRGKDLGDVVGKDIAERIMAVPVGSSDVLTGTGLQIGGDGMKGFYDKIVPNYLNKFGKKWGARVGETKVEAGDDGAITVPFIPVTDAMRTSIRDEGLPLFQLAAGRKPTTLAEQARLRAVDVAKTVIASTKPISAQTAAANLGLKGATAEAAAKRAIPMIKALRRGADFEQVLAKDALKDVTKKPSEKIKSTIIRMANSRITAKETVPVVALLRTHIDMLDLRGQRDALRSAIRSASEVRGEIIKEARRLPKEDRGSLLRQIASVDGLSTARHPQQLKAAFEKIEAILSENIRKDLISQVEDLLKVDATKMRPEFREAFEAITGGIQRSTPTEKTVSGLTRFAEWYEANKPKADGEFITEADLIPQKRIDQLKRLDQKSIRDMSADELQDIIDDAGRILHMNAEKSAIIGRRALQELHATTEGAAKQIEDFNPPLKEVGDKRKEPGFASRFLRSRASPMVMLSEIGGPDGILVRHMFNEVAFAQSDRYKTHLEMQNILLEFFKSKGMSDNKLIDWKQEPVRITLGGRQITVSRDQIVALYAMTRNRDTLKEIMDAGLIQEGFKGESGKIVKPSREELNSALSKMTNFDRELGDAMIAIFEMFNPLMNETSTKLEGYAKYLVENYFPRSRDISGREEELTDLRRFTTGTAFENRGYGRERKSSGDPILLLGAVDVFDAHAKEIADYTSVAIPIRNALRIIGNPKVKEAITTRFGARAVTDIKDYLRDVAGYGTPVSQQPLDKFVREIGRLFATGKLGWRVTTILNNLFGASAQIAGVVDQEYLAAFSKNLGSPKELTASVIRSLPSDIRKKLESPEFRKDFAEMVSLDGYFEQRYERDPSNVILYGQHEIAPSIAKSKAAAALKRAQALVMRPIQEAEKLSAVALYKAVRDNTSKAKAVSKMREMLGDGNFNPDAPDIVKQYAAAYTMLAMRKTQNALDDLDKSSFGRDVSRHPVKGVPYIFQSQMFKLNDMARQAVIELKAAGGWANATPAQRNKFARTITAVAVSGAAVPTVVTEMWGLYRDGFKERDEREMAKRWGMGMNTLFNLTDIVAPELGAASRTIAGAALDKRTSLGRGNYIAETVDGFARGTAGLFNTKDGSAEKAAKLLVKASAVSGLPFESLYQIGEGVFSMVRPDDPLIPLQNKVFKIEEKFGIHEPTGRKRTFEQAMRAGVKLDPAEVNEYRRLKNRIRAAQAQRLKAAEGKISEKEAEENVKKIVGQ